MGPEWFVTHACRALPGRIRSIVLFGSTAAGDFIERVSRYDLLVLTERLELEHLENLGPVVRDWSRAGNPLPLLFTADQFATSADAFAIDFFQIRIAHRVLYGSDPFLGIRVDDAHVRMQLERELKGKLLALRDRYVLDAGDPSRIVTLLCDSLSSFLSLFRVALRLYQDDVPARKLEAARALARHIPFDPQPFVVVEELKAYRRGLKENAARELFRDYWKAIETVIDAVDRLIHPRP